MSQNEYDSTDGDFKQIKSLFAAAEATELDPSPYMRTRILANLRDEEESRWPRTRVWKFFTVMSAFAFLIMTAHSYSLMNKIESNGAAMESYVIHVNFNENDLTRVTKAEVVLPDGVKFVSKNGNIADKKVLRLPIDIKSIGRGKLPFVVTASTDGEKQITVRLLNDDNEVIRDQVLKFKFAKNDSTRTL